MALHKISKSSRTIFFIKIKFNQKDPHLYTRAKIKNQIIIKEGDFFSDKPYQGTETILFTNSRVKIISDYMNKKLTLYR